MSILSFLYVVSGRPEKVRIFVLFDVQSIIKKIFINFIESVTSYGNLSSNIIHRVADAPLG